MSNIPTKVERVFSRGNYAKSVSIAPPAPALEPPQNEAMDIGDDQDYQYNPMSELDALNNDNYVPPAVAEAKRKAQEKEEKEKKPRGRPRKVFEDKFEQMAAARMQTSHPQPKPTPSIMNFNNVAPEEQMSADDVLGRDIRELYTRIQRYKNTFPDNEQIQKLKVPKKANVEQLELVLLEFQNILDMSASIDTFIINSILQILPLAEEYTADTDYDIRGLAKNLKNNKDFMQCAKEIFLKYSSVYAAPVEYRMAYCVCVSTMATISQNAAKKQVSGKVVSGDVLEGL